MGFLTVENNKGFPNYIFNRTPEFGKDKFARFNYIEQEDLRIREGFEGLSGLHYFYLSKITLHDPTTGDSYPPTFRDVDKKILNTYLWCKNHKLQEKGFPSDGDDHPVIINGNTIPDPYDLIGVKPRRLAWTSIFGGCVPMWNAITQEGCNQGLTSCDRDRLIDLVNDKVFYARQSCIENGLIDSAGRWNSSFLQFPFTHSGQTKISNINLLDTANSDAAASSPEGLGFTYFNLDEWFLHPRADKVKLSATSTLLNRHKQKVGIMVQGGSCNAMNNKAIQKLKQVLENLKEPDSKVKFLFIAGWEGQILDKNGFDMKEQAIEKQMKERDRYRKMALNGNSESWQALQNEIKSYPNDLQELISNVESDYLSPNILSNLNKGKIYNFNTEPTRCNLLNKNGNVFPTRDVIQEKDLHFPEGERYPYCIYEHPEQGHTYISGLDPIDFLGANAKGSFFSCVIKDLTTNRYVASLEFRTQDPELGYNLWYNLMYYYRANSKGSLCLAEKNKLASLIAMCKTHNTINLLSRDPDKKHFESEYDRGYHKDNETMPKLLNYGKLYLENNIVPFSRFNESFSNYQENEKNSKKADICDAFFSCEFLSNSMYTIPKSENSTKKIQEFIRDARTGATKLITKIVTNNKHQFL